MLLEGDDYANREALLEQIEGQMNDAPGGSLSVGIADYVRGEDNIVLEVFTRADRMMYQRKKAYKARR